MTMMTMMMMMMMVMKRSEGRKWVEFLDDMTWHVVSRRGGLCFALAILLIWKRILILILILHGIGIVPDGQSGTAVQHTDSRRDAWPVPIYASSCRRF